MRIMKIMKLIYCFILVWFVFGSITQAEAAFVGESRMSKNERIREAFVVAKEYWGITGMPRECKSLSVQTEPGWWNPRYVGMFKKHYYGKKRCAIFLRWHMPTCKLLLVMIHELGHAHGFWTDEPYVEWRREGDKRTLFTDHYHSADEDNIMYPVIKTNRHPEICN